MKDTELIIIGGHGGGGITTIVHEMEDQLSDYYDVQLFNQSAYEKSKFTTKIVWTILRFLKFYRLNKPDLVHINTTSGLGFVRDAAYILYVNLLWRCPIILRTGGSGFDEFITTNSVIKRVFFQLIFSRVSAILVLTNLQHKAVGRYVKDSKIHLFRQVTDISCFSPNWNNSTQHILFLSSLSARKGFPTFVKVIDDLLKDNMMDHSNITISIAGDGEFKSIAKALTETHDCVNFYGYVTGESKFELYNNATIFVLPTQAEGFPNAIIEAMAGGNAIISTDVSGIPELIGEENGIIIQPNNEGHLREAILTMISNDAMVSRMGKNNHQLIREHYTWDEAKERLLQIYQNVQHDS